MTEGRTDIEPCRTFPDSADGCPGDDGQVTPTFAAEQSRTDWRGQGVKLGDTDDYQRTQPRVGRKEHVKPGHPTQPGTTAP